MGFLPKKGTNKVSRANPNAGVTNPSSRWFEWRGGEGVIQWYDKDLAAKSKDKKAGNVVIKVDAKHPFRFIVLDVLASVKGYNKKRKSGIYSNEVRDTRSDPFIVKFFDGDTIAEGVWADIKDKVVANKGGFCAVCYIAFKDGDELKIGAIQLKGCALGPWFDFQKKHRNDIDTKGVAIVGSEDDTTGDVEFKKPIFVVVEISPETNVKAGELAKELAAFHAAYFSRTTVARTEKDTASQPDAGDDEPPTDREPDEPPADDEDSVPF